MPELPEVETVARGLAKRLEGRTLVKVETRRGDLRWPFPKNFAKRLTGRRVNKVRRRAKYIVAELDDGNALLEIAKAGSAELQLWTFQRNRSARRFYEKHRFQAMRETDGTGNEEREPDVLYRWQREWSVA